MEIPNQSRLNNEKFPVSQIKAESYSASTKEFGVTDA